MSMFFRGQNWRNILSSQMCNQKNTSLFTSVVEVVFIIVCHVNNVFLHPSAHQSKNCRGNKKFPHFINWQARHSTSLFSIHKEIQPTSSSLNNRGTRAITADRLGFRLPYFCERGDFWFWARFWSRTFYTSRSGFNLAQASLFSEKFFWFCSGWYSHILYFVVAESGLKLKISVQSLASVQPTTNPRLQLFSKWRSQNVIISVET